MAKRLIMTLFAATTLFSQPSTAAKKYVSDVLQIPIRTGPTTRNKIIGFLKSGNVVNTREESGDWVRVQAQTAKKEYNGWVLSRYLMPEPIAAVRLESLKEDLEKVEAMKAELAEFRKQAASATAGQAQAEKELARIRKASANVISLDDNNRQLKESLSKLEAEMTELREKNIILGQNQRNEGIKLGILAIALGALVGFVLPYMKPRQSRRQSSIRLR